MIAYSRRSAAAFEAMLPLYRLLWQSSRRFYATAGGALPQLDPDYFSYYNNSYSTRENQVRYAPMTDVESSSPRRGVQWAFMGCPHAKKSVYAATFAKLLQVPHISMASLLRQELHPRSSLYKQIANAVNRGELVPENIIFGLLSKRLEDGECRGECGFILDGIPRSKIQAEILDQLEEIDLVVNFKCSGDYLKKYQKEDAWKDKLRAYVLQRKHLEDYYRKQGKLLDFQVGSAPGDTWRGLLAALHLQHLDAACSSMKLTTESSSL